jgi:cell division protein FtsZ
VESVAKPELVPVPASVFDDDFFRASSSRAAAEERLEAALPERFREPSHFSAPARVQQEDVRAVTEEPSMTEHVARVPSFGGPIATAEAESDELDIPAFLRRGN